LGSANAKTGNVALATYRTHGSCPVYCPLWGKGCYAENRGKAGPFGHAERGTILDDDYEPLITLIDALDPRSVVRFNVSGDYLLESGEPDYDYIEATNHAKRHDVLSYTHAWRDLNPEWFEHTTRPNASCDKLSDVVEARDMGWATTIVDPGLELDALEGFIPCLYDELRMQCVDCRLCARPGRKSTVVFPVHGARKNAAAAALQEVV